jgi:hypothetical protein
MENSHIRRMHHGAPVQEGNKCTQAQRRRTSTIPIIGQAWAVTPGPSVPGWIVSPGLSFSFCGPRTNPISTAVPASVVFP